MSYPKTKQQVTQVLNSNGITHSHSHHDYERAKLIIFRGKVVDYSDYERIVRLIANHVGV